MNTLSDETVESLAQLHWDHDEPPTKWEHLGVRLQKSQIAATRALLERLHVGELTTVDGIVWRNGDDLKGAFKKVLCISPDKVMEMEKRITELEKEAAPCAGLLIERNLLESKFRVANAELDELKSKLAALEPKWIPVSEPPDNQGESVWLMGGNLQPNVSVFGSKDPSRTHWAKIPMPPIPEHPKPKTERDLFEEAMGGELWFFSRTCDQGDYSNRATASAWQAWQKGRSIATAQSPE